MTLSFWRRLKRPAPRRLVPPFRPRLETLEGRLVPATFVVANPNDAGPGSLRQAILDANANPGLDAITFSIGSGVRSIALATALPAITDPVILDATTQPGYAGSPLIELNGAATGSGGIGLTIFAGNTTVKGFAINRFGSRGILLQTGSGSVIAGNYIGTDISGTTAFPNGSGVDVVSSNSNHIGGAGSGMRNLISGNRTQGVALYGGAAGNLIQDNYIGTDVNGAAALGNATGVTVSGMAAGNTIGGDTFAAGNVISGNGSGVTGDGVSIFDGATGTVVGSNLIGTDASGGRALGNAGSGVGISSPGNLVGGVGSGLNVLSGNHNYGVALLAGATGNRIQGNLIGIDVLATIALPNSYAGVGAANGAANNTIGSTTPGGGNVISGNNNYGVVLFRAGTTANQVVGNLIGTNRAGTAALGNVGFGVGLTDGAANNIIGSVGAPGNLIAGNSQGGITLFAPGTSHNLIQGNRIGTDGGGANALPNGVGVLVLQGAANNTIGGAAGGAGNLVSGNRGDGIQIAGAGTDGTVIQGNRVGTDAGGANALPNGFNGVEVAQDAAATTVGGTDPGAGNVLSGNASIGLLIGQNAQTTVVLGNRIGTDATGINALPNGNGGVAVSNANDNTIGGLAPGSSNLIAGNNNYGIFLESSARTLIQGNAIGTDVTGINALPNLRGIILTASDDVTIGGTTAEAGNIISGNGADGILVTSGQNDLIEGNLIGTDYHGTAPLGNGGNGIWVASGDSFGILIGGLDATAANVIAYNGNDGVLVDGAQSVAILGNSIFGSGNLGIELANDANNNQEAPTLTAVSSDGASITITGILNGAANADFTLEFFSNDTCNLSGFGEGQTFLGRATVTTDDNGVATFSVTFAAAVGADQFIAATATDGSQNTSAFSACVPVNATGPGVNQPDRFFAGLGGSLWPVEFRYPGWHRSGSKLRIED